MEQELPEQAPPRRRVRRSAEQWASLIAGQADPGLSVAEFCRARGLTVSSFHAWCRRRLFGRKSERYEDPSQPKLFDASLGSAEGDVAESLGGDQSRRRQGHAAENFSRLNRLAVNLLRQGLTVKVGLHGKRFHSGWDHNYLLHLLLHA